MKKKPAKPKLYGNPDYIDYEDGTRVMLDEDDVPELTSAWFKSARKFNELPKSLQKKLSAIQKRGRPKKAVKARPATIRLSPKVDAYFRATGKGWQTRINKALEQWLEQHS